MLAEQTHDLQSAADHYEQHLALGNAQQASETPGQDRAAAFANVMKVRWLSLMTVLMHCMLSQCCICSSPILKDCVSQLELAHALAQLQYTLESTRWQLIDNDMVTGISGAGKRVGSGL